MSETSKIPTSTGNHSKENHTADPTAGLPYYEKTRQQLKILLEQKRNLERHLALHEDAIFRKETEYLDETPQGNIINGFDGYAKGAGVGGVGRAGAGTGRKSAAVGGTDRPFSGSSHSWKLNVDSPAQSGASTPVAAMAPTPLSMTFHKTNGDSASNHATPASASSGKGKKNKKMAGADDSETESNTKEMMGHKKARTNFGAVRK
ncbi:putative PWI domain mRNA processing protein [Sclerotinia borealis F-4128]|uniref:Chromatin modification-related protein EAF6 n=1 Tax=Sclerotinia borealis (strain F-4128) TaxID=1432307 RepID=W9CX58_SCLBF|nr:putative PWI domain mRNA processing protein [Sclerotinia borealis F-4128]